MLEANEKLKQRLLARSAKQGDCLIIDGYKNKDGYGRISFKNKLYDAHVAAYEAWHGHRKKGMHVCHKPIICHTPACINPEHLYLGTPSQNRFDTVLDKTNVNKNKTHCSQGHEFNEINTRINNKGNRSCKACDLQINRRKRVKNVSR